VQTAATRVRRHAAFERSTAWSQLRASIALETRALLRSVPFLLILAFGLINVLSNIGYLDLMMGTPVWPVTYLMLLAISAGYSFLLILILAFYAGETVWRERSLSVDGLLDATPMPTWVPLTAKVTALWVASAVFIAAGMIALAGFQLSLGYRRLEPLVYAQGFVVEIVPFLLIAVLAVFLQATVNQKYVGYLLMVAYLISGAVLGYVHFDHHLYRYATAPAALYSDMNGWGHFKTAVAWFDAYWTFVAGALFCLAYLLWVRGSDTGWRPRLREARARWRGAVRIALPLTLAAAAIAGAWIYCNTNVRNEYIASDDADRRLAEYEQLYGRYRRLPQPTIVAVKSAVDIFPEERRADIRGTYRVVNRLTAPIAALHIAESPRVTIRKLALPPHRVVVDDRRHGYAIYELTTPLQPGQEFQFGFDLEIANPGFVNNAPDNAIVANGTFFHSAIFPSFGYQDSRELVDPSVRRRHGLPPPVRMARIDDMAARFHNDLARDADWIDFETTVSTSADQIAIAPGDLQREWSAGGRRYFHYVAARPIPKFFAYLSGRYTVRHDAWNGIAIDIYHHPDHPYNVSRMIDAVKKTLAYMAENFSPYQHRHVRIIEFPRYMRAAASFPGSIPFSESIGFIARLKSPSAIDYPFYVTAHEVAHQWWGYQVLGADVQGAAMLSESMAQYAALMVMRREYGPEKMRRFLKYELDGYLRGRGAEPVEELPLELVENQPYIHYRKGSLALYALQDAIGEAALNDALRRYIASVRFQAPPYTVSRELLAFVAAATPPSRQRLLDDLFRSITLFDLRADTASAMRLPDGRFEVALRVDARKLRADGQGVESEVPIDDWIDVGVFGERRGGGDPDQVLYLQKHHVTSTGTTLRIVVDGVPLRAGIDPFNTFIDRVSGDNVCAVQRNN
jgi:hypothetical protein